DDDGPDQERGHDGQRRDDRPPQEALHSLHAAAPEPNEAPPISSPRFSYVASSPSRMPTIRPSYITAIRSPTASTSSSSVLTITIAPPASRCCRSRRWMYSIEPTSRPRVGWAAITSWTGTENSRATTTFCWLPPES